MLMRLIRICAVLLLCLGLFSCDRRKPTQAITDFSVLQLSDETITMSQVPTQPFL